MTNDQLRFLGLMRRAGKLASGEEGVKKAVLSRKACRILLASDASENAEKRAKAFALRIHAPVIRLSGTKAELADAFGTAAVAMYAICDEGFATAFDRKLAETEQ